MKREVHAKRSGAQNLDQLKMHSPNRTFTPYPLEEKGIINFDDFQTVHVSQVQGQPCIQSSAGLDTASVRCSFGVEIES
ncbi:MAG: hypothetical protein R3287_13360, partial [Anderseniella sp.]|nr:hypothetical protein [Anderseniella sp.]